MRTIIFLLAICFAFSACNSDSKKQSSSRTVKNKAIENGVDPAVVSRAEKNKESLAKSKVSPEVFKQLIEDGNQQLIDVRTAKEYEFNHIKNAKNIDIKNKDEFEKRLKNFSKSKPILVYCASGGRSGRASKILKKAGFKDVNDLEGGITKWISSGFEVEKKLLNSK